MCVEISPQNKVHTIGYEGLRVFLTAFRSCEVKESSLVSSLLQLKGVRCSLLRLVLGVRAEQTAESALIPVAEFLLSASSLTNNVLPRYVIRSQEGKQAGSQCSAMPLPCPLLSPFQ